LPAVLDRWRVDARFIERLKSEASILDARNWTRYRRRDANVGASMRLLWHLAVDVEMQTSVQSVRVPWHLDVDDETRIERADSRNQT
jgi:hypothetical protein